ncbi:hypothetical protein PENTCL1PPCAC_17282, partial [Pristionchus entomophagus]
AGGPSYLTIRGQLFCNGNLIGGRAILYEKDLMLKEIYDEVDILISSNDPRRTNSSLIDTCGPISQIYLHGQESELNGAEWILKIEPKCDGDPLCGKEFVLDWSERSMSGRQNFLIKNIDVCSQEHRDKASSEPHA